MSSAGLTRQEVEDYGIGYCADTPDAGNRRDRVVLPCYGPDGLSVVQYRRLASAYDPRKYITYGQGVFDTRYRRRRTQEYGSKTLVVVEDILSAVRCGRYHRSVAALHGSVPVQYLVGLAADYDTVVIWLDNDNLKIKRASRDAYRQLSMVYKNVLLVTGHDDPKHHTDEEIQMITSGEQHHDA